MSLKSVRMTLKQKQIIINCVLILLYIQIYVNNLASSEKSFCHFDAFTQIMWYDVPNQYASEWETVFIAINVRCGSAADGTSFEITKSTIINI